MNFDITDYLNYLTLADEPPSNTISDYIRYRKLYSTTDLLHITYPDYIYLFYDPAEHYVVVDGSETVLNDFAQYYYSYSNDQITRIDFLNLASDNYIPLVSYNSYVLDDEIYARYNIEVDTSTTEYSFYLSHAEVDDILSANETDVKYYIDAFLSEYLSPLEGQAITQLADDDTIFFCLDHGEYALYVRDTGIPAPAAGENLYGWTDENRVGVNLYKWTETTPTTQLYAWTIQSGEFAYKDGDSSKPVTTIYTTTPNPSISGSSYSELFDEYGNSYGNTQGSIMSWTLYDGIREMGETYVDTMSSSAITMMASGPV